MRRQLLFAVAALCLAVPAGAQPKTYSNFQTILSFGFVFPAGAVVYTGLAYRFGSLEIGNSMLLSFEAAVEAQFAYANMAVPISYVTIGGGLFGSATLSFQELGGHPFLQRFSISAAPGYGFNAYRYSGDPAYFTERAKTQYGFAGFGSIRVKVSDRLSTGIDFVYWGEYIGPNIGLGVLIRL